MFKTVGEVLYKLNEITRIRTDIRALPWDEINIDELETLLIEYEELLEDLKIDNK